MTDKYDKYIDEIFNEPYEDNDEQYLRAKRDKDNRRYRLKTTKSGELLESEIYPVWDTRKKRTKEQAEQDKDVLLKVRLRNIQRNLVRLVNGNFCRLNIWITLGYRGTEQPACIEDVKKDVRNYIKRLKRYAEKMGWPDLKYIYVIEGDGANKRFHVHMIMNFRDRDIAEKKWGKGKYPQARRLQPNDYGFTGLAMYITKETVKNEEDDTKPKAYGYSLGLFKSWQHATISDSKMTKSRAEKIAREEINLKDFFEKLYPGYDYKDTEINISGHVSGWYIYTRMRKRE